MSGAKFIYELPLAVSLYNKYEKDTLWNFLESLENKNPIMVQFETRVSAHQTLIPGNIVKFENSENLPDFAIGDLKKDFEENNGVHLYFGKTFEFPTFLDDLRNIVKVVNKDPKEKVVTSESFDSLEETLNIISKKNNTCLGFSKVENQREPGYHLETIGQANFATGETNIYLKNNGFYSSEYCPDLSKSRILLIKDYKIDINLANDFNPNNLTVNTVTFNANLDLTWVDSKYFPSVINEIEDRLPLVNGYHFTKDQESKSINITYSGRHNDYFEEYNAIPLQKRVGTFELKLKNILSGLIQVQDLMFQEKLDDEKKCVELVAISFHR